MIVVEQAGAIIVRSGQSKVRILLVTARRNPNNWIFPKGHVEPGESLEATALREAHEEAGITGTIIGRAGSQSFTLDLNSYKVHYYVVATSDEGGAKEGRACAWLGYERALQRVAFDGLRDLLISARPTIEKASA